MPADWFNETTLELVPVAPEHNRSGDERAIGVARHSAGCWHAQGNWG